MFKHALGLLLYLATALPACGDSAPKSECTKSADCPSAEVCLSCVGYPDGSNCKIPTGPFEGGRCLPMAPKGYCVSDSECTTLRADLRCFGTPMGYCDLKSL